MIDEVLRRRVKDLALGPLPDLFLIDGGKGQLAAAKHVLKENNIDKDIASIAKGERRKRMEDIVYLPGRKNPLPLSKASPVFKEIVKMRDEAHRFAVSSHHRWKKARRPHNKEITNDQITMAKKLLLKTDQFSFPLVLHHLFQGFKITF